MDKLPLLDLDFRTTYVENNVLYTPSKGSLVSKAVMGTGVVGNTNAPTITNIGAGFDGTDYINTQSADLLDWNVPRTIVMRIRSLPNTSDQTIISTYSGTPPYWTVQRLTNNKIWFLAAQDATQYIYIRSGILKDRVPQTIIITLDGTGFAANVLFYIDGKPSIDSNNSWFVNKTLISSAHATIGRNYIPGAPIKAGTTLRRIQIYPFCMTPSQVRAIHERFEREGES